MLVFQKSRSKNVFVFMRYWGLLVLALFKLWKSDSNCLKSASVYGSIFSTTVFCMWMSERAIWWWNCTMVAVCCHHLGWVGSGGTLTLTVCVCWMQPDELVFFLIICSCNNCSFGSCSYAALFVYFCPVCIELRWNWICRSLICDFMRPSGFNLLSSIYSYYFLILSILESLLWLLIL